MGKVDYISSSLFNDLQIVLTQDCFALFGLKPDFNVDQELLAKIYYQKQAIYHPDNFIRLNVHSVDNPDLDSASYTQLTADQRSNLMSMVVRVSAHINDAYVSLKDDLLRAIALLKSKGIHLDLASNTSLPQDFLMFQMEIYENVEDLKSSYSSLKDTGKLNLKIEKIKFQVQEYIKDILLQLNKSFAEQNIENAILLIKKLSCSLKLQNRIIDDFDDFL